MKLLITLALLLLVVTAHRGLNRRQHNNGHHSSDLTSDEERPRHNDRHAETKSKSSKTESKENASFVPKYHVHDDGTVVFDDPDELPERVRKILVDGDTLPYKMF